jgi:aryl-alcohol dehydrogenase-like predicted oxidoreductase
MNAQTVFGRDDLRKTDPKFQQPRFGQYLDAIERLDQFACEFYEKRVIHLAVRWVLDKAGVSAALWGARRPDQLDAIDEVSGWHLGREEREEVVRIVDTSVVDPVGPEFMAPPTAAVQWRHDTALTRRVQANG